MIIKNSKNLHDSDILMGLKAKWMAEGKYSYDDQVVDIAANKIKKEASLKVEASDNLLVDISRLACVLKEKGFEKVAIAIACKLAEFKAAESKLDELNASLKMVEEAHPEGDVSIGDSEYGKVETLQSAQDKIKKTINSVPAKKAAEILGVKLAQISGMDYEEGGSVRGEVEGFLSRLEQFRADTINSIGINSANALGTPLYSFNQKTIMAFAQEPSGEGFFELYSKFSKRTINKYMVQNYITTLTNVFGEVENSFIDVEFITSKINSYTKEQSNELKRWITNISPSLSSYVTGVQRTHPSSIWVEDHDIITRNLQLHSIVPVVQDQNKVGELARKIYNLLVSQQQEIFGNMENATKELQAELNRLINPLLKLDFGSMPPVSEETVLKAKAKIAEFWGYLKKYTEEGVEFKSIMNIMNSFQVPTMGFEDGLAKLGNELLALVEFIDSKFNPNAFKSSQGYFEKSIKLLSDAMNKPYSPEAISAFRVNLDSSKELLGIVSKANSFNEVYEQIKDVFPKVKDQATFVAFAKKWYEDITKMI